jgi:DNA polymerase III subunit alpha
VLLYIDDARKHGIEILPPDVNESRWRFTVVDGGVRFGLSAVKGIGEQAIQSILVAREELGRFESIDQFLGAVDQQKVNKRALESLIKCGAFDSLGHPRAALTAGLDGLVESAARTARDRAVGQESLFGATTPGVQARVPDVPEWGEKERLANEKDALGFFITGHPMDAYTEEVARFASHDTTSVREAHDGASVSIAGIVTTVRETITKRGQGDRMGIVRLEDLVGGIEVVFFPRAYRDAQLVIAPDIPLLVEGSVKVNSDGSVDIVGNGVRLLQDVREDRTKQVWVDLDVSWVDEAKLKRLRDCFAAHEGKCSTGLKLVIPGQTETELKLPGDIRVEAVDSLRDEANQIFERKVVRFR